MSTDSTNFSGQRMTAKSPAAATPTRIPPALTQWLRGDLGAIPVVITLILVVAYFQIASRGLFLQPANLSNLSLQITTIGVLALAAVLVLVIAEIDLSLASVAYLCGAVTAVLSVNAHWAAPLAILGGIAAGLVIGFVNGIFIALLRVPAFIVTLGGFILYQGVLLRLLEPNTSLFVQDRAIKALAGSYVIDVLGVGLPALAVVLYGAAVLANRRSRERRGLAVEPLWQVWARLALVVVIVGLVLLVFELNLGVPLATMILLGLIVLLWLVMRFTTFGRHVYAVGGNPEAARRAGINVVGIRLAIFTMASTLAAIGGILSVARNGAALTAVDPGLLLNAIAAAVIGGVSLFGGRGSVWSVVLGALVLGALANGLFLLNQPASIQFIVEGAVLVIAVTVDALLRRRGGAAARH